MTSSELRVPEVTLTVPKGRIYSGEVVYIYSYDVAYDMTCQPIRVLLGQPVEEFTVGANKRSPRQVFFYRPQMVRLPPVERIGPHGAVQVERVVKLLPVGAISITVRVPFAVNRIEDLVVYHDLQFSNGSLHEGSAQPAGRDPPRELAAQFVRPVAPTWPRGGLHGVLH